MLAPQYGHCSWQYPTQYIMIQAAVGITAWNWAVRGKGRREGELVVNAV